MTSIINIVNQYASLTCAAADVMLHFNINTTVPMEIDGNLYSIVQDTHGLLLCQNNFDFKNIAASGSSDISIYSICDANEGNKVW